MGFEDDVRDLLEKRLKIKGFVLEVPKSEFGDLAFPCFILSKELKKSPVEIAKSLATDLKPIGGVERIEARGPYINFYAKKGDLARDILGQIEKEGKSYGSSHEGQGKRLLIEHTSINPNASPHVGRARNAIIGDSVSRIMAFQGYDVDRHYFVNDIGKQIAMLVLGAKGKPKFDELLGLYIRINKELETHPEREKEVFALLNKLESGDENVRTLFHDIVQTCVEGQATILGEFGIFYDAFDYESDFLFGKETAKVLEMLQKTGKVFEDEDKRLVLDLKGHDLPMEPPLMVLTRADGTSLYGLRDIAYNLMKLSSADRNVVILGEDQKLYFKQVASALKVLGYDAPEVIHYSFVLLSDGKMSTRQGNVVLLEDFIREAREKAKAEIEKRGYTVDVAAIARSIGYGAVKYSILKVSADKNVTFDWDSSMSFEGETAPYIQYAHARICSVMRKAGDELPNGYDPSVLATNEEIALLKQLRNFPAVVKDAERRPHVLANYLYILSKAFSDFYHEHQVLKATDGLRGARLHLIAATQKVLETGLGLLGIDAPKSM